jgi:fatty-acyl-CoA synthase
MNGLVGDYPLTLQHLLWRGERLHTHKEIITRREQGIHRITYPAMIQRAARLAGALRRLGIGPEGRVGSLAWNNWRHMELYYAVPCMGSVLHTLNARLHPDQLAYVIEDAQDQVIVVDRSMLPALERIRDRIPGVRQIVVMSDDRQPGLEGALDYEDLIEGESSEFAWPNLDERQACTICYTSGTTGNPKGVLYSHRSQLLHAMAALAADLVSVSEQDVILPVVPMYHVNAWGLPYAAGLSGANLVFPDRFLADGQVLCELTNDERVTILAGVPTIWMGLLQYLRQSGKRLPTVRFVLCGGSAAPPVLIEGMDQVGLTILHAWGMTETSPLGSVARVGSWIPEGTTMAARLSQGRAGALVEVRLADLSSDSEVPWDGESIGELQCRGPWVASAYYKHAGPDRFTDDGWLRTGDVASIDPDGYIRLVDRTKDVIKSGGEWISSVELEGLIMAHPKVREAAVIGLPHPKWSERPVAYVVAGDDGPPSAEELREFLEAKVPRYWLPDEIRFIDEVPKTSVGKFDKRALREDAVPLTGV